MPNDLTLVSVKLDRETIRLLDQLQTDQTHLNVHRERKHSRSPYRRSELLRHAITAGLDVLTDQPALKL